MRVTLTSRKGDEFDLTGSGPVFAPEDAFETLVAGVTRTETTIPGRPGIRPGPVVVGPILTTLELHLNSQDGTVPITETYARLYDMWSLDYDCTMKVETDHPLCPVYLPLRLEQSLPGLPKDKRDLDEITVPVPIIAARGVYATRAIHDTGIVTVTNSGDVTVHPEIRWHGEGGQVTTPSTATFILPAVDQPRRVLIDAAESCAVLDDNGVKDEELSDTLSYQVFPEATPKRSESIWQLPEGAEMIYSLGIINPWR